jgi:hypothetical protein
MNKPIHRKIYIKGKEIPVTVIKPKNHFLMAFQEEFKKNEKTMKKLGLCLNIL